MKKYSSFTWLVVALAALLFTGNLHNLNPSIWAASSPAPKLPQIVSFATAAEGTTSYIVGGAFANILKKYLNLKVAIETSGAATRWVPLMGRQEVDFGIHCAYPDMNDAYYGLAGYQKMGPQPILSFADGHIVPWALMTNDPSIKTVYDLKGKRLYGRIVGQSLYERGVPALLSSAGLTGQVEVVTFPNVVEAARGLVEGRADALLYLPMVAPVLEANRSRQLYAVAVPKDVADKVNKIEPALMAGIWKKGMAFAAQDTPSMFQGCGMAVRETLSPDVVAAILRTVFSHYDEYKGSHSVLPEWTAQNGIRIHATPFHPGAISYYKEKGLWTAEAEKRNQELIAKRRK
ncbi:MAG: TAXI family TRAP transporter solute-binding subunit [Deltaproteobacteria bacterium]|nr:TAXI family TRAP transporter solute-binding subunit [Deltaproteobacteria bacterium]